MTWRRSLRDVSGATAAEFAMVLPIALLFLFGIIDVGRYVWAINTVEKAVQAGARYAVVTDLVANGINDADFADSCAVTLAAGDTICAEALPKITCTSTACSCAGGDCGAVDETDYNATAFNNIVTRMRVIAPYIGPGQVSVAYTGSGIGYYGDPACAGTRDNKGVCSTGELADVAPVVTVNVSSLQFRPLTFALFGGIVRLPGASYSLTLEDGFGAIGY